MRTKSVALLTLALGCGLVASIGITQVMGKRTDPNAGGETETIFVAMKDVGLGDFLSAQVLRLEQWPKGNIPAGALTRIEDVEGRRARTKLYAGEPILDNKLFRRGVNDQGPDALIPKGYRVVTVKVDAVSGSGGLLLPGTRVDVMAHLTKDPSRGVYDTMARTVLEDVKVFAVNDVVNLDSKDQEGSKPISGKTISLLVTPEQAAMVILASEMGKIKLVMRSPEDDVQAGVAEANPHQLLGRPVAGEREKETLLGKPEGSHRAKPAAAPARPRASWTVRILKPGAVDDIVMEADGEESALAQGFGHWKWLGASPAGGANALKQKTPPPEPVPAKQEPDQAEQKQSPENKPN